MYSNSKNRFHTEGDGLLPLAASTRSKSTLKSGRESYFAIDTTLRTYYFLRLDALEI